MPDGRYRMWVADAAGEVVGMAGLVVIDRPPHPRSRRAPEAMVFNVMTAPAWRRRGVGRAVMEALIADGRALGCRRLVLRASDEPPKPLPLTSLPATPRGSGPISAGDTTRVGYENPNRPIVVS